MSRAADFGYVQARMQARLARLPSEADWGRLSASRSLASFLEEARSGVLQVWLEGFSAHSRASQIELGMRSLLAEQVEEVAGWVPACWCEAVRWVAWLSWLPLMEHLARGGDLPRWAERDPRLAPHVDGMGRLDADWLARSGLDVLLASPDPSALGGAWLAAWRERWPALGSDARARLESLLGLIGRHRRAFCAARPEETWTLRLGLHEQLRRQLHASLLEPAAVFAYLGLVFLDLEHLRGALLRRALFAEELAA